MVFLLSSRFKGSVPELVVLFIVLITKQPTPETFFRWFFFLIFVFIIYLVFIILSILSLSFCPSYLYYSTYLYFNKSPRCVLDFKELAETMDCRGLKLLQNVQIRWISLLDPLRRLVSQYRAILAKMYQSKDFEAAAEVNFIVFTFTYLFSL